MTDRRGPEQGYDFGNKRQYRRNIWNTFVFHCGDQRRDAPSMLMPSIEGDEVEVALSKGFRNLHVVDMNPAIVATLKRRFPFVVTYGVTFERAAERIGRKKEFIRCANLDLCANVNENQLQSLRSFANSGALRYGLIAVTMLRGREQPRILSMLDAFGTRGTVTKPTWIMKPDEVFPFGDPEPDVIRDRGRVLIVASALDGSLNLRDGNARMPFLDRSPRIFIARTGTYRSNAGTQTMLWAIYKFHHQGCSCDLCLASFMESSKIDDANEALEFMQRYYGFVSVRAMTEEAFRMRCEATGETPDQLRAYAFSRRAQLGWSA